MTTTTIPSYESVEKMIYKLVTNFWQRYGGDYDDLLSAANWVYIIIICQDKYDPNRHTKFSTFLYRCIYNRLLDIELKNRRRKKREMTVDNQFWNAVIPKSAAIYDFRQDAETVVRMLLISHRTTLQKKSRRECKKILRWILDGEGWTAKQITDTFKEIGRVLG
ncbi:hypothetical protein LCGC14_0249730 [marine sediment metagenome]|uniref:RNA polymerase sigma-70 region 2 domain-containing protein n=1 Tax=marine sediment metagenome TaxID=412755 RepID=A0A0F9U5A1_9ZZZZ